MSGSERIVDPTPGSKLLLNQPSAYGGCPMLTFFRGQPTYVFAKRKLGLYSWQFGKYLEDVGESNLHVYSVISKMHIIQRLM